MQKYLTCNQVAERYSVKLNTVRSWIRKKKLSASKIGKEYRVTAEDLAAFETASKTK